MRDFNFFEKQTESSKVFKYNKKKITLFLSFILLLFIISATMIIVKTAILKKEISKLQGQLNKTENKAILSKYESNKVIMDILSKYKDATKDIAPTLENKVVITTGIINEINSIIPQGVTFKTITMNDSSFDIQGVSTNKVAIAEFSSYLEAIKPIKSVKISSISGVSLTPGGEINFTINCKLKDVVNDENK